VNELAGQDHEQMLLRSLQEKRERIWGK